MIYFKDKTNKKEYCFCYIETNKTDIAYKVKGTESGSIWTEWNILFGFHSIMDAINCISLGDVLL